MLNRIKNTNILVHNFEEALHFYTQKLGFEEYQNFPDQNWVAVCVPGKKEHIITFCLATDELDKALVGNQLGSYPIFILEVDDCTKLYNTWRSKELVFNGEVKSYGKGSFFVVLDCYGNKIMVSDNKSFG